MKRLLISLCVFVGLSILLPCQIEDAQAQLVWRVSVKFILNGAGNRPATGNINTDAEVNNQIDTANLILRAMGRGYRLDLTEIVDLSGVSQWYSTDISGDNKQALENAAMGATSTYAWRSNAINIYINGDGGSGICSFPGSGNIIFLGQGSRLTTFLHEIGHFMDLCHTQGCPCGSCDVGETGECNTIPASDEMTDIPPDLECWDQNDIAQWTYGLNYNFLSASQQAFVDRAFFNVMSYHGTRNRFSSNQLDRMTCTSNNERDHVTNGRTWFVGTLSSSSEECLTSTYVKSTFATAASAASNGDIVNLRAGAHAYTGTTSKPMTLRASRGSAFLGQSSGPGKSEDPVYKIPLPNTSDGKSGP